MQIKLEKTARICPLLCENSETDIIIYYQENSIDNNCSRVYRLIIDYLINHASPNGVHTLMNVRKEKLIFLCINFMLVLSVFILFEPRQANLCLRAFRHDKF